MASSRIEQPSATEFRPLFEVPLPEAYFSSEGATQKALSTRAKGSHKLANSSRRNRPDQAKRRFSSPDGPKTSSKIDQQADRRWTCASPSCLVPGIFLGHSSGQVWHWHAEQLPAKPDTTDQGVSNPSITFCDCSRSSYRLIVLLPYE